MLTFLDLLIVVFMVVAAAGLLAVSLMFLVRNKKVRKVCLYLAAALGIYTMTVAVRICWPEYFGQVVLGVILALAAVAAIVLERLSVKNEKLFLIARILAAVGGIVNAFMI